MPRPYTPTTRVNGQTPTADWWNDLQNTVDLLDTDLAEAEDAIGNKADASHTHSAADITSGTIATSRLGSGTANSTTFLRGDGSWATPAGGGGGGAGIGPMTLTVAASDAPAVIKARADYICVGSASSEQRKDATTIMTAITALGSTGGRIQLSPGTFFVKGTGTASAGAININKSNVEIVGCGMGTTIIKLDNSQASTDITGIIRTDSNVDLSNIRFADFTIDGNKTACIGRVIGAYTGRDGAASGYHINITFERIECKNCFAYAIDPHERAKDVSVLDCWAHHNGGFSDGSNTYGDGITVDWVQGFVLRGNRCEDNVRHGISPVTGALNGIIEGNRCSRNGENGIAVQLAGGMRPVDITVRGNICDTNGTNGIYINKCDRVTVEGNICFNNVSDGIRIYGTQYSQVQNNKCRDNVTAGTAGRAEIRVSADTGNARPGDHNIVSGNQILALATTKAPYGIRVDNDCANNYIHGNKVVGSPTPVSISATNTTGTTSVANV